jgi:DNA-binding response OmpR family regulator/DNA-binding CsgD family transcriptional regulator
MKSAPDRQHPGRILIIDDVPANLALLGDLLKQAGFRVFVAESGESALEQAPFAKPDIILVDIMMPGLDGFETCRRFKALPNFASVPLFFMSALTDVSDKLRGFEAGAVDYINKPFQPQEVLARIRAHLEIRALHRELSLKSAALEEQNERLEHAVQLRLRAENAMAHQFDRPLVIVNEAGHVHFRTTLAAQLLDKHHPAQSGQLLPAALQPLIARPLGRPSDGLQILLLEEPRDPPSPAQLAPLGLTPRETEVLFWIAQGKTSPEIVVILDSNLNTVKKHVQNMLPKLGVETRLAAALKAMELLQPA